MIKYLLPLLFLSSVARAGFPPTTSQGTNDSGPVTTFNYDFANCTISHTGITASISCNGPYPLPSPSPSGEFLESTGTGYVLGTPAATAPGGSNTDVQYNSSGSFAGSAGLTYIAATSTTNASILNIPTTTSLVGQITQNGSPFLSTYGTNDLFLGSNTGNFLTGGHGNIAVGNGIMTLLGATGSNNDAIGYTALNEITTGNMNVAVGTAALNALSTGSNNMGIGLQALALTNASNNVAVGVNALVEDTSGAGNTAIGYQAGYGGGSNYVTTGSNNTYIGFNATQSVASGTQFSNAAAIGANAVVGASNAMVLGNGVNVGINTSVPQSLLQAVGAIESGSNASTAGQIKVDNGNAGGASAIITNPSTTVQYNFELPATPGSAGQELLSGGGSSAMTWGTKNSGTVTSVALSDGSTAPIFTISGSPVTSSGTLTETLSNENANTVLAGPTTGSAAQPTFRGLVSADIPNNAANTTGTAANITASSNSTLTTLSSLSLPYSQVTGAPSAITALTGDVTASGPGSSAATLATVNSNVGSFTNANITVNGKGLITAASSGSSSIGSYRYINITNSSGTLSIANQAGTGTAWALNSTSANNGGGTLNVGTTWSTFISCTCTTTVQNITNNEICVFESPTTSAVTWRVWSSSATSANDNVSINCFGS